MSYGTYESEKAFERTNPPVVVNFQDLWPSETRGRGKIRKNNLRNGSAQGKGSFILKADCRQCGFPVDLSSNDHSGGSIDANGANFVSSTATATVTLASGATHTEKYGNPGTRKGAGCPVCGSKNSTAQRITMVTGDPWSRIVPLGF